MPFRPGVWEAAESVYTENNRTRKGRAAVICWTLGRVVWSKEMKMLRHSHSGMRRVSTGNKRVAVSGLGEVGGWNRRGFGAI